MKIAFEKFHGAGNDFIIFRSSKIINFCTETIKELCDRKRGIGADGIILLIKQKTQPTKFIYYNADGSQADFCGNGLRCAAKSENIATKKKKIVFLSDCGVVNCTILSENSVQTEVPVISKPIEIKIRDHSKAFFCSTGVPHLIIPVKKWNFDIEKAGRILRYDSHFKPDGTNVNFAEILSDNEVLIRTYERGVEAETEACGTGAAASALCLSIFENLNFPITVSTKSNYKLCIELPTRLSNPLTAKKLLLTGPVKKVFEGYLNISAFQKSLILR